MKMEYEKDIIEEYFLELGAYQKEQTYMDPHGKTEDETVWILNDRELGYSLPDIHIHFNLFIDYVINEMKRIGFSPKICTTFSKPIFSWGHSIHTDLGCGGITTWNSISEETIIDDQWLVAAIKAGIGALKYVKKLPNT